MWSIWICLLQEHSRSFGHRRSAVLTAQPASNQIQVSALTEFDINNKQYISIGGLESHSITAIDAGNKILTLNSDLSRVL